MRKLLAILALLIPLAAFGQFGNTTTLQFPGVPTGTCSFIMYALDGSTGDFYDCFGGTWHKISGGGGGGSPPAGVPKQLQYNLDGTNFGAVADGTTVGQVLMFNGAGNAPVYGDPIVSGPDAPGVAPTKNPVQIGLFDGTNVQRVLGSAAGRLSIDINSAPTITVAGTVTTTPPSNASTNIAQFGGTNISTGTGTGGAGIPRVTVSNDSNVLATQSGTWNIGTLTTITNPVGATQSGSWTVTANAGTNLNTSNLALDATLAKLTLAQASTTSGQSGTLMQGAVTTGAPSYTTAQTDPLSLDTSGRLRIDNSSWLGSTAPTVGSKTSTNSLPVVIASDQGAIAVTPAANSSVNLAQYNTQAVVSSDVNGLIPVGGYSTRNASDAAWTSATGSNTAVTLISNIGTYASLMVSLVQGTTITGGVVTFEMSNDNSTWIAIQGVQLGTTVIAGPTYTLQQSTNVAFVFPVSAPYFRVRLSTVITGSGTVTIGHDAQTLPGVLLSGGTVQLATGANVIGAVTQSAGPWTENITQFGGTNISTGTGAAGAGVPRVTISNDSSLAANQSVNVNQVGGTAAAATAKGTQATNGIGTQDFKDAGRTALSFYANNVAAGTTTTETLFTLTKSSGTGATSSATTFVITSGKKFRITAISVASRGNATATVQSTVFNLRLNTGGACIVTSTPILFAAQSATPATASAWDRVIIPVPDGYEITGDGTIQFCLSAAATYTTNAPTWSVNIMGFEY